MDALRVNEFEQDADDTDYHNDDTAEADRQALLQHGAALVQVGDRHHVARCLAHVSAHRGERRSPGLRRSPSIRR
jgi:hypothetical protein